MVRSKPSLFRDFKQNLRTTEECERAFLVDIDYRRRTRLAQQARDAALARREREASATEKFAEAPTLVFGAQESLDELRELTLSAGGEVAGEFLQSKDKPDPATVVGKGKLEEISAAARSAGAQLVIFDHDLSASQQRNIENVLHVRVIGRTQLILDIFARHARTREGQLQVELAQLNYLLPRLTGRGVEMSRLGGGIGTRGPGETQLETDRRRDVTRNTRRRHAGTTPATPAKSTER